MRTIKFRGKSKKTGEWLNGYYLKNRGVDFICPDEFANGKTWEDYEVLTESVGQFTGLLDKNGKEVYEGDLVRVAETENHVEIIAVVRFNEGRFTANSIKSSVSFSLDYVFRELQPGRLSGEVIRNIYDNPEPLKTETL